MPDAEFIGPTSAQLSLQTSAELNKTMQGMADFFANMADNKQKQAMAKQKAQDEQNAAKIANLQKVADTMVANSATKSVHEVVNTPEGQTVFSELYSTMGVPKEVLPSVLQQLANNPLTADQIDQAMRTQFAGEQVQAAQGEANAGKGVAPAQQAAPGAQAASSQPNIPGAGNMGVGAVQAPAQQVTPQGPVATATTPEPMPVYGPLPEGVIQATKQSVQTSQATPYPPYMQQALGPETVAPAGAAAPPAPAQQKQQDMQTKQTVQDDARAQAKVIAQEAGPSAAAIFLKKQLDPNSIEFLTNFAKANPSEYYKDTDPKHVEAFQANLDKTLAERKKLGLENDEISINLKTLAEKNKTDITYTKALTLQALMAASTAQINAKLASASYQTNNAVLTKFLSSAQDREDEANKMYTAVTAKEAKATVADVAHLNSLVEQANSYYKQANRIVVSMHVSLGGNPKEAPQFSDVPSYIMSKDGGLVGGFGNALTGIMQGEASQTGQVTRGAQAPTPAPGGSAAGVGTPTRTQASSGTTSRSTVPSGFTPAQQAMNDDIVNEYLKSMQGK